MKKIVFALLLIFPVFNFAQTVRLEGSLIADKEAIKLGQATVFSLPDSTLKKGTYLDSTFFSTTLNTDGNTDFYLKVTVPGYSDAIIDFNVTDTVVLIGAVKMEKNVDLGQVDIVYRKQTFKRTLDGIQVNVEGTNLQTLTNLFEVLKASPKITSPDDERIEIIGRGSPLILVDRQAIISNDELKAIPASQIERIEIITNPSAKYKAQGSGNGVIEVYTKNFHLEGYNVTVSAAGGVNTQLRPAARGGVGISLKKKKFSLNGYVGGNYNASNGFGSTSGFTTDDSNRTLSSGFDNESTSNWQYFKIKAAYNINAKQILTFGVNGNGSGGRNESVSNSDFLTNEALITRRFSNSNSSNTNLDNSAFLNYSLETDTNNSVLEINLNYNNKVSNSDATYLSAFQEIPTGDSSVFQLRNESRDIPNVGELRVNYQHNFDTTGWRLEFGGSFSALFNNKRFDQFNNNDNVWVLNPELSNSYDYQESIGAVFAELSKKWNKFGFRVGARGEYTKLDGFSNSLNQQFIDSVYILPFPTTSILYEPNPKLGITAFYKTGINRPQFDLYDPFVRVEDSLNVRRGNPFLRPSVEQTFGIDFDILYAYGLSLTYKHVNDPRSTISFIDEESFLTESTSWNAELEQTVGASFNLPFRTKRLQGWNSVWVNYSKYSFTPIFGREDFFNLTYGAYSYLTLNLKRNLSIQNRLHINKWGGSDSENNTIVNWGLRVTKKYNGNKFQIFADVANIIPPRSRSTQFSGNFQFQSNNQSQFTTFKVGLYYKFGRLKSEAQIKETTSGQSGRL